jgi:hypothetical protein
MKIFNHFFNLKKFFKVFFKNINPKIEEFFQKIY